MKKLLHEQVFSVTVSTDLCFSQNLAAYNQHTIKTENVNQGLKQVFFFFFWSRRGQEHSIKLS